MAAPKGNTYWQLVKNWKVGADPAYTPEGLWVKAIEYFEWADNNPYTSKAASAGKSVGVSKRRPYTLGAFCIYANICENTFRNYRENEAYMQVTTRIDQIIYTQKFEGAMIGEFNPNIVARDLGLVEKQEVKQDNTITTIRFGSEDEEL